MTPATKDGKQMEKKLSNGEKDEREDERERKGENTFIGDFVP